MSNMSNLVIKTDCISKKYYLGANLDSYSLFSETLMRNIKRLLRPGSSIIHKSENNDLWALRDISLEIKSGEIVGLIGKNGAGKSTLLKILSRVTYPTKGEAIIRGRVGSLLEVGTGFHPELTGRENVLLNGLILGMSKKEIERKFDEIVEFAEVERFIDTPVKRYSSGMYVRLAFSVAVHLEPEILIVDEVLAVGDAAFQKKCLSKLGMIASEGRTILMVSHNIGSIKSLCSRAILLDKGQIVDDGDVERVANVYLDRRKITDESGNIGVEREVQGTLQALLRRIVLLNEQDEVVDQVYLGQRLIVKVLFESFENLSDVVFELGISTMDGLRIITVINVDEDNPTMEVKAGMNEISVVVEVTLLPRDYTIDFAMHYISGATIDWVEDVYRFSALNISQSGNDYYRWNTLRGYVRPHALWQDPKALD